MIKINRLELALLCQYVDKDHPQPEINCVFVDEENIVSTNTRGMAVIKHGDKIGKPYLIAEHIVAAALKIKDGAFFCLKENAVEVKNREEISLMTITGRELSLGAALKYKSILGGEYRKKMPFVGIPQMQGLVALERIHINQKLIPNIKGEWQGYLSVVNDEAPIMINSEDKLITIIIMPIVDELPVFRGGR